jgi:putative spermidine/putrescine transport system ATP-binding protein
VALARAVVFSPRIVLMDEPLSALDKNLREQMQVEIRHLHEKIGATTIYVTHDQREALTISDRIAVMNHGRVVQCDTPANIYENPGSAFVAEFIGETTLLPVTRTATDLALPDGTRLRTTRPLPAAPALLLALRAERLLMPDECGPDSNRLPAVLRDVIYQGDSLLMLAEIAGQSVALRRPLRGLPGPLPSPGTSLSLGLDAAAMILVPA